MPAGSKRRLTPFTIMSLTFIDFFAGIGGFRRGMELAGHKCVGFCEFDKFAVASYTAMHLLTEEQRKYIAEIEAPLKKNGAVNYNKRQKEILKEEYRNGEWYADDIRRVDARSLPRADVWCFGFPCQDISIAGKQKGFKGNRSSLFFAVTGLLRTVEEESRPKHLFIENVKNLLSVNRGYDFARLLVELDEIGYDAEWQVLNSKDFGVPQNRERVFIIGHLRGQSTGAVFPLREVGGNDKWQGDYIVKQIGNCMPSKTRENPNQGRVYDPSGISPTLGCMQGGNRQPMVPVTGIAIREATKKGYAVAHPGDSINLEQPNSKTRRGRVGKGVAQTLTTGCQQGVLLQRKNGTFGKINEHDLSGVAPTLTATCYKDPDMISNGLRIRRLTPKECFRLQGWEDEYFYQAEMVNSDSQLYKQAGNGVTVPVIEAIAKQLN